MKLDINYYHSVSKNPKKVLIFVGGDGDDKNTFTQTIKHLAEKLPDYNFCTFSHTTPLKKSSYLSQTVKDLESVCNCLLAPKSTKNISIFCTSMGAFSVSHLLTNPQYQKNIDQVIFCDPADYYLASGKLIKRGQDNPKLFPRLNTKMVKVFYSNLPKKNRAKYIEDKKIPHGIKRDGNIEKNQRNLARLILQCLKS